MKKREKIVVLGSINTDMVMTGRKIPMLGETVSGGKFYDTGLTTFRVNVPLAEAADASNFKTLLLIGNGVQMSSKTTFTFSTANDDQVYVHIDNFAAYKVSEAEFGALFEDEEFEPEEEIDWI